MSVAGYFSSSRALPRMSPAAAGEVGARFEGAVLQGELSIAERFCRDAALAIVPGASCYNHVEEYDPVLEAHCRLSVAGKQG